MIPDLGDPPCPSLHPWPEPLLMAGFPFVPGYNSQQGNSPVLVKYSNVEDMISRFKVLPCLPGITHVLPDTPVAVVRHGKEERFDLFNIGVTVSQVFFFSI